MDAPLSPGRLVDATAPLRGLRLFRDGVRQVRIVAVEAIQGFRGNDGLRHASSLAFYTALALIPALLLLTFVLGLGIGSSEKAMLKTSEFLGQVLPRLSDVVLHELEALNHHGRSKGLLNLVLLLWALSPLVATLRAVLADILKVRLERPFWTTKLLDLALSAFFITGLAAIAGFGLVITFLRQMLPGFALPKGLGLVLPLLLTTGMLWAVFVMLTHGVRSRHLLTGALTTAALWFLLRPAFGLFLAYNPGYGVAFGSFKSLFIVTIWLYYSMAVFILGAEVIAALHRRETVVLKRLMEGREGMPETSRRRFIWEGEPGDVLFQEGDVSREMYHLVKGEIRILKGGCEIAVLGPGTFFGEMSFLLGAPRSATAVVKEACEAIRVDEGHLEALMREYPGLVRDMLTEMAGRLRATSEAAQGEGPARD